MFKPVRIMGVLAAVALLGSASCVGHECTLLYPRCAFDLMLEHPSWEPGAYEFEFHSDGTRTVCTAQLPLGDGAEYRCDDGGDYFDDIFAADENRPFPRKISFFATPDEVEIVIRRDGTELVRRSFRPQYAETEPNGEGCGICENAAETLTF